MYWYVSLYLKAKLLCNLKNMTLFNHIPQVTIIFLNYVGDLILPNWRPMKISDICSDENKTVGEVLGHLRIPPTLRVQIRYAIWNLIRMVYLYYVKSVGYMTTLITIIFYVGYQGFSVGGNTWLSSWSVDPLASTDINVR